LGVAVWTSYRRVFQSPLGRLGRIHRPGGKVHEGRIQVSRCLSAIPPEDGEVMMWRMRRGQHFALWGSALSSARGHPLWFAGAFGRCVACITWSRQPVDERPFLSSSENWGREVAQERREGGKDESEPRLMSRILGGIPQKCAGGETDWLRRQMRGGLAGVLADPAGSFVDEAPGFARGGFSGKIGWMFLFWKEGSARHRGSAAWILHTEERCVEGAEQARKRLVRV
jgi:hypothetical protein